MPVISSRLRTRRDQKVKMGCREATHLHLNMFYHVLRLHHI
jgi:hypothetical protein